MGTRRELGLHRVSEEALEIVAVTDILKAKRQQKYAFSRKGILKQHLSEMWHSMYFFSLSGLPVSASEIL